MQTQIKRYPILCPPDNYAEIQTRRDGPTLIKQVLINSAIGLQCLCKQATYVIVSSPLSYDLSLLIGSG